MEIEDDCIGNDTDDEDFNDTDEHEDFSDTDEYEQDVYEDETDDDDEDDAGESDDIDEVEPTRDKNLTVLKSADIRIRLQDEIMKVSSVLFVSREEATILLCNYNWDADRINEEWFANEEKVRQASGLLESYATTNQDEDILDSRKEFFCGICLESHNYPEDALAVGCGHLFCRTCWGTYISISINDGRGCLMMRCPQPQCGAAVGQDLIYSLASDENKEKYDEYILRSYVEDGKKTKWCPAPGCDCAVAYVLGRNFDVTCHCSYGFCWNCLEEAHSPVNCETTAKWIEKNSSEAENTNWILVNTKPCPKCKKPIEKNHGCMHMTCNPPCRHQFCWLCLGPWSEHGEESGGFYKCNSYEKEKKSGKYSTEENKRKMAKKSLEKYTHYYERWASNDSSRQKALKDLKLIERVNLEKLSKIQGQPVTEFQFIIHAWKQIVECRRALKWSYAYGYFLPEDECKKKQLFEYMQGEAEAALERLHNCAEEELHKYYLKQVSWDEFIGFRHHLVNLTGVTGSFFHNLVKALENDMILSMSQEGQG